MATVTLKGNAVTLSGTELKVGDTAPDFVLQNTGLEDVTLAASAGKTRIIATIPSLDTSVCHAETKRFNDEAAKLSNVAILVVSTDLPFGQKRWCGAEGVDKVACLSDHRTAAFGKSYGVLITGGPLRPLPDSGDLRRWRRQQDQARRILLRNRRAPELRCRAGCGEINPFRIKQPVRGVIPALAVFLNFASPPHHTDPRTIPYVSATDSPRPSPRPMDWVLWPEPLR